MRPNRPSNNQDAAALGNFIQGLSKAINQSQVRPPRPAPFVQPVQPQFVQPVQPQFVQPAPVAPPPPAPRPPAPSVQPNFNSNINKDRGFKLN